MSYSNSRIMSATIIGRTVYNTNPHFEIPRHNINCRSIGKRKFKSAVSTKVTSVCFIMHMLNKFEIIIYLLFSPEETSRWKLEEKIEKETKDLEV